MRFTALSLAAVAIQVVYGATIDEGLQKVDSSTAKLGDSVKSWKGDFLGTLPIIGDSLSLLTDINDGTKDAEDSDPLTLEEALVVAGTTTTLVDTVNTTLQNVIDRKADFDKLLLGAVILGNLQMQRDATDKLSTAIVDKVPTDAQSIAQGLIDQIDASFQTALDAYKLF